MRVSLKKETDGDKSFENRAAINAVGVHEFIHCVAAMLCSSQGLSR